jgi:hypothetical protein
MLISRIVTFGLAWLIGPGACTSGGATEYRDLPLSTFGVSNSTLTLVIESEILVPALSAWSVREANLSSVVPYKGSEFASNIAETLKSRSELSAGHAMPYFYLAVHQALSRIFRNSLTNPRSDSAELAASYGLSFDPANDSQQNLRDLVRISPITGRHLTLEIYSTEGSFRAASNAIGLHSAAAFWDQSMKKLACISIRDS